MGALVALASLAFTSLRSGRFPYLYAAAHSAVRPARGGGGRPPPCRPPPLGLHGREAPSALRGRVLRPRQFTLSILTLPATQRLPIWNVGQISRALVLFDSLRNFAHPATASPLRSDVPHPSGSLPSVGRGWNLHVELRFHSNKASTTPPDVSYFYTLRPLFATCALRAYSSSPSSYNLRWTRSVFLSKNLTLPLVAPL